MGVLSFEGKMWIMGGRAGAAENFRLLNDVWSSTDGAVWQNVIAASRWAPRMRFGYVVFNQKIWVLGGVAMVNGEEVVTNSVYSTSNGERWDEVRANGDSCTGLVCLDDSPSSSNNNMWAPRHSMVVLSYSGRIWVLSGVGGLASTEQASDDDFVQDVWSSTDGVDWSRVAFSPPWGNRRAVVGTVHQLRMYVLAESRHYRYYYNVWGSGNGIDWTEPAQACSVTGQPLGSALVMQAGMVVVAAAHELSRDQPVRFWVTEEIGAEFNGQFKLARGQAGEGPREEARHVVFNSKLWQLGGACADCGLSAAPVDAFASVYASNGFFNGGSPNGQSNAAPSSQAHRLSVALQLLCVAALVVVGRRGSA